MRTAKIAALALLPDTGCGRLFRVRAREDLKAHLREEGKWLISNGPSPFDWSISRFLLIAMTALATRLITLGNPILYTDEEFYFAVGKAMSNGALPFVDIWDRKPIGLFLVYLPPASLPGLSGILLYQLMALGCVIVTALAIAALADRGGWSRGGTLAGIAYLAWITIAGGHGGQAPVFYNAAMAIAALLMVSAPASFKHSAAAMLLAGVAIQIKSSAAVEGVFFGLWLMYCKWRETCSLTEVLVRGVALALLGLLPTILAMTAYAFAGELPAFIFSNFQSIFTRNADPAGDQLVNLAKAAAILLPLLGMGCMARIARGQPGAQARAFLMGWLAAALLAFTLVPPVA